MNLIQASEQSAAEMQVGEQQHLTQAATLPSRVTLKQSSRVTLQQSSRVTQEKLGILQNEIDILHRRARALHP